MTVHTNTRTTTHVWEVTQHEVVLFLHDEELVSLQGWRTYGGRGGDDDSRRHMRAQRAHPSVKVSSHRAGSP
jgi:hypothetical protein